MHDNTNSCITPIARLYSSRLDELKKEERKLREEILRDQERMMKEEQRVIERVHTTRT